MDEGALMHPEEIPERRRGNVLGIVGFILAFCVSPIGLLLSLIALARPPRGLAIGGVVVGLVGSALWALVIGGLLLLGPSFTSIFGDVSDYTEIANAVEQYKTQNNGSLPADLAALNLSADTIRDHDGNLYGYTVDQTAGTWSIIFIGWDGLPDSGDEVELTGSMSPTEAGNELGNAYRDAQKAKHTPDAPPSPQPASSP